MCFLIIAYVCHVVDIAIYCLAPRHGFPIILVTEAWHWDSKPITFNRTCTDLFQVHLSAFLPLSHTYTYTKIPERQNTPYQPNTMSPNVLYTVLSTESTAN